MKEEKTMKKLFCMILAIIMLMSLCACGEKPSDHGPNDSSVNETGTNQKPQDEIQETTVPAVPTEEEKEVLETYVRTVDSLNREAAKLKEEPYSSLDVIQEKRTELLALDLDTVSKWAGTEWAQWAYDESGEPDYFSFPAEFDCEAVLSRFTKVENVKLSRNKTAIDSLGNASGPEEDAVWDYFTKFLMVIQWKYRN